MPTPDGLMDALAAIQAARDAIATGDIDIALVELSHANRFFAVAVATRSMVRAVKLAGGHEPEMPMVNENAVSDALKALRQEISAAIRPRAVPPGHVVDTVATGLEPLLGELRTEGADPATVIAARARNIAFLLLQTFEINKRKDPGT